MIKLNRVLKSYRDSGALHANIGIQEAVDDKNVLKKGGHLVRLLRFHGIDDECLDPQQVDQIASRIEAALRLLGENFRLYQYQIKGHASPIDCSGSESPLVEEALKLRTAYLNSKQLYQIEHYWAVVYEGSRIGKDKKKVTSFLAGSRNRLLRGISTSKPRENLDKELVRLRQVLAQAVEGLGVQLQDVGAYV